MQLSKSLHVLSRLRVPCSVRAIAVPSRSLYSYSSTVAAAARAHTERPHPEFPSNRNVHLARLIAASAVFLSTALLPASADAQQSGPRTSSPPPAADSKHDWKTVISSLNQTKKRNALPIPFSTCRKSLNQTEYLYDIEFDLQHDADVHTIVSALSFYNNNSLMLKVHDTPTRRHTNLSSPDGKFQVNIYVPRIKSITGRVVINIVKRRDEGEHCFSNDEIHSLVSCYTFAQKSVQTGSENNQLPPWLLDGTLSVDIGPPTSKAGTRTPPTSKQEDMFKTDLRRAIDIDVDVDKEKHKYMSNADFHDDDQDEDDTDEDITYHHHTYVRRSHHGHNHQHNHDHGHDHADNEDDEHTIKYLTKEQQATKTKAQLKDLGVEVIDANKQDLSWDMLAGYEQVKKHIEDTLVLPLKYPDVYKNIISQTRNKVESNIPTGILLFGPPGCGKTLTAKILASTLGIPFIHVKLEALLSKYYGETTKKLAQILELSNSLGKCVVFLDECDSIGLSRDSEGDKGGIHETTRRTLSVLLRFLDGIEGSKDAIILAATNCKEDLDSALVSRFDTIVNFPLPDFNSRVAMLRLNAKQLKDTELSEIARSTWGFSGRELVDICEDAERTKAGEIVRLLEKGEVVSDRDNMLPAVSDYINAVTRKEEHVVGRTNARFAKPELLKDLLAPIEQETERVVDEEDGHTPKTNTVGSDQEHVNSAESEDHLVSMSSSD